MSEFFFLGVIAGLVFAKAANKHKAQSEAIQTKAKERMQKKKLYAEEKDNEL